MNRRIIALALTLCGAFGFSAAQTLNAQETYTPGMKVNKTFKAFAQEFVTNYCVDCHDDDLKKGNLSLADLGAVDETNADLWTSIWAQVTLKAPEEQEESTRRG